MPADMGTFRVDVEIENPARPGTKPSFLLDLEAGGPTELATLSGAVSRYADAAGVPTPVHDTAAAVLGLSTR